MGTGDAMFGKHLAIHGIYPNDGYVTKPQNFDEILAMLGQPRPALDPAESYDAQFQEFLEVAMEVADKSDTMKKILPLIAGQSNSQTSGGHAFNNMKNLTDGSIVKLKPDIYDGADPDKIDAEILKQLRSFLQPLEEKKSPVVPNFFAQFRSPKLEAFVGEHQVRYAGALGARAIHHLRSFAVADPETVYDNNAYTITATYQARMLTIFVHRPVKPLAPGGPLRYRMTFVTEFAIYSSLDSFQKGVIAFRNAREWATTKRDEFIAAANARKQTIDIPPAPGLSVSPRATVA